MGKSFALLAGCAALAVTAAAHAQDGAPRTFTQSGPWSLDAGEDYCRLAATFANGEDSLAFALERNSANSSARMILIGDAIRPFRGADRLGYSYLPDGSEREAIFYRSEVADGQPYFNLGYVSFAPPPGADAATSEQVIVTPEHEGEVSASPYDRSAELAFAVNIEGIEIDSGLSEPVRIETGSLRAPIQALQTCVDDLLLYWGLDYQAHQTMTRRAVPAEVPYAWFPVDIMDRGDFALLRGGNNTVRVMVDEKGEPTDCQIHWPILADRKNALICEKIMEGGSFQPALDADGNPMASYWTTQLFVRLTRYSYRR